MVRRIGLQNGSLHYRPLLAHQIRWIRRPTGNRRGLRARPVTFRSETPSARANRRRVGTAQRFRSTTGAKKWLAGPALPTASVHLELESTYGVA